MTVPGGVSTAGLASVAARTLMRSPLMNEPGAGSRRERANRAFDVPCRRAPVDGGLVLLQLRRVGRAVAGLRRLRERSRRKGVDCVHDQPGGERGKHVVQRAAGGLRPDGHRLRR